MKKMILFFTALISLSVSCKKDTIEIEPKSQWVVDGITYQGPALTHPLGSAFDASDRAGNFISINFSFNHMPKHSGGYSVKEWPIDTTQCRVTVRIVGGGSFINYTSVDSTAEVFIYVSPQGKLAASFSNIPLWYFATGETKTVSGRIEE